MWVYLLVVDGASGSHSVSIGGNHTEVGGAMEEGWRIDQWLQVVAGVVCSIVCDPGPHVISRALTQHEPCDLYVGSRANLVKSLSLPNAYSFMLITYVMPLPCDHTP